MDRRLPVALAVAMLSGSPAHAGGPASGDAAAGADLAARLCAGCHAVAGPGPGPHPAAPAFTAIAARWPAGDLAEALAEGIAVGHSEGPRMPEFALPPDEIEDLIAYLDALARR